METPSSTGRSTRSQVAAECTAASCFTLSSLGSEKSKQEESHSRSRNGEEGAGLVDVTNDSPVVGLAAGRLLVEKTASSSAVESQVRASRTALSGEEVLRGQVRTLLQKVEEDAELVNKLLVGNPTPLFSSLLSLAKSPMQLLAPTPANTPQNPDLNDSKEGFSSVGFASPCVYPEQDDRLKVSCEELTSSFTRSSLRYLFLRYILIILVQVVAAFQNAEERLGPQELLINRTLTFDSPDKSDVSSGDDEELDGLCEGLKKLWVLDVKHRFAEFTGKHTRFIYNSDDEIEGEEEVTAASPSVLVLKGLPTPEGKHLRFQEEEEEED
ncbi:hypothetical protein BHE74_00005037 [Ensete ventricosum]|uniref:Uncharacterized protein n=1 Tax=Ensete ventricosum TaxID=4639 RepID=A0A444DQK8_ENSVE|nr:hypothetical protein GW17_00036603 [Ensete ventricosum]RWW86191.1 hypothetical protein BHE74_00005037 [Ensete ventricosum]RZR72332.1 hypothetical protein BHM03_00012588 [Ensete ventricosum]